MSAAPAALTPTEARADATPADERTLEAKVLVALGELGEAERLIADVLADAPGDLTALNLYAKIKHVKGELSRAVACWAQLHGRSPHNELALLRLMSLLELARDPNRRALDFVTLGQPGLTALFEPDLESAFRELMEGKPDAAKATCARLANKHRGRSQDLYKLCVMARAWIAELSGDLLSARAALEELGRERGFETDTDRVLGLARVYERLGDRKHLEDAVRVNRWLDRSFEKISAQSRLAFLHSKLGNSDEAAVHERRFQLAFERRMHRPSRAELALVAGRRFFPLDRLRAVRASSDESSELLHSEQLERSRVIFQYLTGDVTSARAAFERADGLLDRKYLGSLLAAEGDVDAATRVLLDVLAEDPHDAEVASFLLTHDGVPAALVERVLAGALGEGVHAGLEEALRRAPRRARTWQALASLHRIQGRDEEATRHAERGRLLHEARRRDEQPIGRVLSAAVYMLGGKRKGLVHQIWADRKPAPSGRGGFLHADDILGNLTPEMRQAVRNTFLSVREYARSHFPHRCLDILDFDYTFKVTKDDEPSGGLSAGLPTALAFLSVFLRRPVPQDVAFTGVLVADAHDVLVVRSVGDVEYKLKAAYHRNLRALLLPAENRQQLLDSRAVPRAATEELARFVTTLDDALAEIFGPDVWLE